MQYRAGQQIIVVCKAVGLPARLLLSAGLKRKGSVLLQRIDRLRVPSQHSTVWRNMFHFAHKRYVLTQTPSSCLPTFNYHAEVLSLASCFPLSFYLWCITMRSLHGMRDWLLLHTIHPTYLNYYMQMIYLFYNLAAVTYTCSATLPDTLTVTP